MLGYYLRLALKSCARTPGLTALMIGAIALGIGVCIATLTVYHAMSGNPLWWKNDRVYSVTMPLVARSDWPAESQPPELTYRDAVALLRAPPAARRTLMYPLDGVVSGADALPVPVTTRVTSADFFAMFDVPFLYGGPWGSAAEERAEPLMVISRAQNDALFGGVNSVGRTLRWNERLFRIVGVLDAWRPVPRFYDLHGAFNRPEDVYIPFSLTSVLQPDPKVRNCAGAGNQAMASFQDFLGSECVWVQTWVELPDAASRARLAAFLAQHLTQQHAAGRELRAARLTDISRRLRDSGVVSNDSRILLVLAFAFLGVCVVNTVGILLARFLRHAPVTGVRRALGARRRQIVAQHLVEVGVIACCGGAAGLGLGALGLWGIRTLFTVRVGADSQPPLMGYDALAHFDTISIAWALALALLAALGPGLYPAWRAGRLPPAAYLRSQ
jgi:putative ABC transport system permease protein